MNCWNYMYVFVYLDIFFYKKHLIFKDNLQNCNWPTQNMKVYSSFFYLPHNYTQRTDLDQPMWAIHSFSASGIRCSFWLMPYLLNELNNLIPMEQKISPILQMSVLVFCIVSYLLYHNVTFLLLPLQTTDIVTEIITTRAKTIKK